MSFTRFISILIISLALLAAIMLTEFAPFVSANDTCPQLDSSYAGFHPFPKNGTFCEPEVIPLNEVCKLCRQVIVPLCYCPAGYTCGGSLYSGLGEVDIAPNDEFPSCLRCPSGYYCPYGGATAPIECPKGFYCPEGSYFARECYSSAICPKGSSRQNFLGGIIGIFLFFICGFAVLHYNQKKLQLRVKYYSSQYTNIQQELHGGKSQSQSDFPMQIMASTNTNTCTEVMIAEQPIPVKKTTLKASSTIDLAFDSLGLVIETKTGGILNKSVHEKVILKNVSGMIAHGHLTAVMGPSGAGKTSFLNVLCGKVRRTSGSIFINGMLSEMSKFRKEVGFVPQDDIMLRELTVEEILLHSARVRLPASLSQAEICARVDQVIAVLKLEEVRFQIIGDEFQRGISGGQRKRVNIGMELVADTNALFLDEPTSGLDSTSAEEVMEALVNVAASGINVVAVVHQPKAEVFFKFDSVMFLAKGGCLAYHGPTEQALEYFQSIGYKMGSTIAPPDFILDVLAGGSLMQNGDEFELQWQKSDLNKKHQENVKAVSLISSNPAVTAAVVEQRSAKASSILNIRKTPNFFAQVFYFGYRSYLQSLHGLRTFVIDNVLFAFTGVYIGIAFIDPKYVLPIADYVRQFCPSAIDGIMTAAAIDGDKVDAAFRNLCSTCNALEDQVGLMGMYMSMGLGVMATAVHVRTFGNERSVYWRDASSGINTAAYFVGKTAFDFFKMIFLSWSFMAFFYLVAAPFGSFGDYYALVLMLVWNLAAVGYICSLLFSRENAGFIAVLIGIIFSLTSGLVFEVGLMGPFAYIAYPRWFGEGVFSNEVSDIISGENSAIPSVYSPPGSPELIDSILNYATGVQKYATNAYGYDIGRVPLDCLVMFIHGIVLRVAAYAILRCKNLQQQR